MTKETRIGLLVGLGLIILFGLVLGLLNEKSQVPAARTVSVGDETASLWPPPVSNESRSSGGSSPLVASVEAGAPGRAAAPAGEGGVVQVVVAPPSARPDGFAISEMRAQGGATETLAAGTSPPPEPAKVRTHTVAAKDNLYKIAQQYYGDARQYKRIYEANRAVLPKENVLKIGQVLVIPDLPGEATAARPAPAAEPATGQPYRILDASDLEKFFAGGARAGADELAAGKGDAPSPAKADPAKAPGAPAAASASQVPARRTHVVQRGESLSVIARKYYNNDSRASVQRLYLANQDKLPGPDSLPIGVELKVPS